MQNYFDLYDFSCYSLSHYIPMKKVRICKKDPTKALKAFEPASHSRYDHRRDLTGPLIGESISRRSNEENNRQQVIVSHRYSNDKQQRSHSKKYSLSPRGERIRLSYQREKTESIKGSVRNSKQLRELRYRSSERSPYLARSSLNKSDHKLFLELNKSSRSQHKIYKPIRLNSLQNRKNSQEKDKNSQEIIKQAKKMMMSGQIRKSIYMLKGILKNDPHNVDALYVSMMNWYSADDPQRAISYAQKIHELQPGFHSNVYIVWSKILQKQDQQEAALSKLDIGLKLLADGSSLYAQKGNILLRLKKHEEAAHCFEQSIRINPKVSVRDRLLLAYSALQSYEKVLEMVSKILEENPLNKLQYLEIEAETLLRLKNFETLVMKFKDCSEPSLLFYLGFAYYQLGDRLKAYLILESALEVEDCTRPVRLMLLIKIQQNDYYEARHLLERCQYLSVPKGALEFESLYIEGVICLMRRHMEEGVEKLSKICEQEQKDSPINEFSQYIYQQVHGFIAYGMYCLGKFYKCWHHYQIQKKKYPNSTFDGMDYNIKMTQAYLHFQDEQITPSMQCFCEAIKAKENKLQPNFCLAMVQAKVAQQYCDTDPEKCKQHYSKAKYHLKNSVKIVQKIQNNSSSNVFYHKCLVHCFLEEWREAILCIDQAIERAEENDWKHFYVRSMILSSIHNFGDAINDCTVAINLKPSEPEPYFLRSRCFQIEGEGNNAFKDLQNRLSKLALRPDDKSIHKYAGKLLFENGAFEDAITAFEHEPIEHVLSNLDAFLTKSKTYFLLGQFEQAAGQMLNVYNLDTSKPQALFDVHMMRIVGKIININSDYQEIIKEVEEKYTQKKIAETKHQIFKKTQRHTLKSICYFYLGDFKMAIQQLTEAIKAKQKTVMRETLLEGTVREDEKDTRLFVSQMHFNISICWLMLGDINNAIKEAHKMAIRNQDAFFQNFCSFINLLEGKYPKGHESEIRKLEVFPNRNKISNFIPEVWVEFRGQKIQTKICIPFPKVEPPEIFPEFDTRVFNFDIENVDRKPEAPWILREENTVNFTGRVQKYSRLQIEDSINDANSSNLNEIDSSHISLSSISSRRMKLVPQSAKRGAHGRPH